MPSLAKSESAVLDVPTHLRPQHVAIIMDGNGRWAQHQNLPRVEGHLRGVESVRNVMDACNDFGVHTLTLYCLSSENWKRPAEELEFLMTLLKTYLIGERDNLIKRNLRLKIIGRRERLSQDVQMEMDRTVAACAGNDGMTLCLAINYGGRSEIVDATRELARNVAVGKLSPEDISEATISNALYTAGLPDPDLLIRTSGEMRISNFLLWQISYAEIYVTSTLWPEFGREDLAEAIRDYANRDRRFGGLQHATVDAAGQSAEAEDA
ncbi:MAG: isoprenyl transferase [Planctomycetales bacterium]|nr:isoprenyl transferase [Planctomycetales bacterium]